MNEISKMLYKDVRAELEEVWRNARPFVSPKCRACPECNGKNCRRIAAERSTTGERNYEKFQQIKIVYDTLYDGGDGSEIDSSVELFGHTFRAPVCSAPFGNVKSFQVNTHFDSDYALNKCLVNGLANQDCLAWTPDTVNHPGLNVYEGPLKAVAERRGLGIPTIKAWAKEEIQHKIRLADNAGAIGIGHDIDCVGLGYLSINGGYKTYPKTPEAIKEIFSVTNTPYILKGIMSVQGAVKALKAGAYGIVVSNHAGNTMDQSLSTIEVLPDIVKAVGGQMKVLVDGGISSGEEVFKAIAMGADAVLIGRPYLIAAEGGETRGIELYTQKIIWQLQNAMRMSGCRTLKDINRDHVVVTKDF